MNVVVVMMKDTVVMRLDTEEKYRPLAVVDILMGSITAAV